MRMPSSPLSVPDDDLYEDADECPDCGWPMGGCECELDYDDDISGRRTMTKEDVPMEIDTGNWQGVGLGGDDIVVMLPMRRMSKDQALVHAAWLSVLADPSGDRFAEILRAVKST